MAKTLSITATDGSGNFNAYVAEPTNPNGAAVIAIQEIFGVNAGMRQIADKLADDGYLAVAPDLFWRQEPGIELTDQSEDDFKRAFELYKGFDVDKGMADITATIAAVRARGATKVGAVGYCLGGYLAYLTAARTNADAAVSYYGVGIQDVLDEAKNITKPLMLHIAGEDEFVPAAAQAQIHSALDGHDGIEVHDYPGRDHAFARPNGIHHHAGDAAAANARTQIFFANSLR